MINTVTRLAAAALLLSAVSPAVASASPRTDPTTVTHGREAPIGDIPWSTVGPGWTLATWSPVTPHKPGVEPAPGEPTWETTAVTLYLVSPTGDRYAIRTFPRGEIPRLVDWSGDAARALFASQYPADDALVVDLHTGAEKTVAVNGHPVFSRPDGRALLVTPRGYETNKTLRRIDLDGHTQFDYSAEKLRLTGDFTDGVLQSPDGTRIVVRTDTGLVVVGSDGTPARALATPSMGPAGCTPVRWWSTDVVLAYCFVRDSAANQLWTVPLDGSVATPLTALNSAQGDDPGFDGDFGDLSAWALPSGTFLQSTGGCGTVFLSRLTSDGHTARVNVPGMGRDIAVAGTNNGQLDLLGKLGCGDTDSLVRYDPSTNRSTVLLGPPVNGGGVTGAVPFGGRW
jgi:hypothetical protein